ncbi:glycosyltransferase family 4 protein [Flavobacterium caeni]|uniref:Glycosyltransferase involved in cell wall bisynthesis n=1 Tax=Flavobacterium caeni TaxID=490189 RepID=A0A1G5FLM0_9FLAO|nr:glycosyltransferase family 4 protein [Flavobacterium caeni]SCY40051.1 Glycosyltransferase involved in cell wall bisynthesis [Flavobacterium caeni]
MMHICFVTDEYPKEGFPHGGIGSFVKTIAKELVQRGVRVSVVGINYTQNREYESADDIHVFRLPRRHLKGFAWWANARTINKTIAEIHRQNPITVVETAELGLAFLNKIKGVKYVIRTHGGHHFFSEAENRGIDPWKGFQEKRSFAKADAFITVSEYVKTHTAKYLSYKGKPVETINYPVNIDLFRPISKAAVDKSIVFAGTVCEKKGVRQLVQAFEHVKEAFPAATLHIYGRDWFFPDGSSYVKMLQDRELPALGPAAASIFFHGPISHLHLPEKYAEAHVCAFPSHMETQGLVVPEAMLMKKAVVFSALGPGPETIVDGQTGLLCNPHSPEDIAQKIQWVFDNPDEVDAMAERARTSALTKYSPDRIVGLNLAFYKSL